MEVSRAIAFKPKTEVPASEVQQCVIDIRKAVSDLGAGNVGYLFFEPMDGDLQHGVFSVGDKFYDDGFLSQLSGRVPSLVFGVIEWSDDESYQAALSSFKS